jgi:hypothetical protein
MSGLSPIAIQDDSINVEELRARLRKMTDAELLRCGKDARFMCSPGANFGKPPRECFLIALKEAREEWRRRKGRRDVVSSTP